MALQPAAYSRFVLPLLVLVLASACGGGSTPPPPPPEEDTSAPTTRAEPAGGTFTAPVSVTLTCSDGSGSGCAATHYTTDGSTPSPSSPRYTAPLNLSTTTTLKFFSVDVAGNVEAVKTEQYTLAGGALVVSASPRGGTYGSVQTVTLTCNAIDVTCVSIRYTTDGSTPTASSPAYTTALTLSTSTTLSFIGVDNLGRTSPVVTETYVIDTTPPATTASPAGGSYDTAQNVTLSCNDGSGSGCAGTYYTTNGLTPNTNSTAYTQPIRIDRPLTLKFFSVDRLGNAEPARSESYTFTADVAPPTTTADPAGGVYASAQNVTLICNDGTNGSGCSATYYTTDGSTPTPSSPRYTSPIAISTNSVLRFFSVDQRNNTEPVQSASYFFGRSAASISAQIAAVRAAADGPLNQAIDLALVTYVKPSVGGDAAGFFLQAERAGPALFVAVSPSSLNPVPAAGDRVTLTVTQKATVNGMVHATAVTNFLRNGTGESVEPLRANVTHVDLAAAVSTYEGELISITGILLDTLSPSGAGYVASTLSTTVSPNNPNLQLRLPNLLQDSLDVSKGCQVIASAPLWRTNAQAQASGWASRDITIQSCPSPRLLSAVSNGRTGVTLHLDRRIDPSSVQSNGSQFTFTNGLTASAATVQDRDILLTTSNQSNGENYRVTLATSIRDTLGNEMDVSHLSATFSFQAPAVLRLNELNPNIASGRDVLELYVVQGGNISNFTLMRDTTTLTSLPALAVATGDIIVVHFNPDTGSNFDAPTSETTSKSQYPSSTYTSNYDAAWDVHAGTLGLLYTTNSVVLVKNAQGAIQDAAAFARPSVTSDTFPPLLQELQATGQWLPANCGGAACTYTSTPTAIDVSASWEGVSTDRTTTVRRVSPTDTHQKADWAVGPSSLGVP